MGGDRIIHNKVEVPESNDRFWMSPLHYEDVQGVSEPKIHLSGLLCFTGFGATKMKQACQYIKLFEVFTITREVWVWVADLLDQAVVQY